MYEQENKNASTKDTEILNSWVKELSANNIAETTIKGYLKTVTKFREIVNKPFIEIRKKDVVDYYDYYKNRKPSTKNINKVYIRAFFCWLINHLDKKTIKKNPDFGLVTIKNKSYPKLVSWFKTEQFKTDSINPDEVLTLEDVKKLIAVANNFRDKCLIGLLYETGGRSASEFLKLKYKDVKFEGTTAIVTMPTAKLRGRKEDSRRIFVMDFIYELRHHMLNHPTKNPDDPLFISSKTKKALGYCGLIYVLSTCAKKCNFKKKYNAHWHRHSKATYLSKILTDAELRVFLGHVPGSNMIGIYTHLNSQDVINKQKAQRGMETPEVEEVRTQKLVDCPNCKIENDSNTTKLCIQCSSPLDSKIIIKDNKEMERMKKVMGKMQLQMTKMYDKLYSGKGFDETWDSRIEPEVSEEG